MSRYFLALSLTRAPQMIGIFEEAEPLAGAYDPAGIDMIEDWRVGVTFGGSSGVEVIIAKR
jgi:hypothetical protein